MAPTGNKPQHGQLAIVGQTQRFFNTRQLKDLNPWVIDQLTHKTAPVEIWSATQTPFKDDLTKHKLLKKF